MSTPTTKLKIALLGLDSPTKALVLQFIGNTPHLDWPFDLEKLLEGEADPEIKIIICGPPPLGTSVTEVAQTLRMQFQDAMLLYLTSDRAGFVRKDYIKNGFNDAFLVPLEGPTLSKTLREEIARLNSSGEKTYRAVKLVDIQPGQAMDFDTFIYLSTNNKRIRYSSAGDPIDAERVQKLSSHKVNTLEVASDDMKKFYKFTARQLRNIGRSETMGATEREDKMQSAVRELVSDIFHDSSTDVSFEKGKAVIADCQEIVKAYILDSVTGTENNWYEKLLSLAQSENTAYTHSADVATFSAMFSMALGIGVPEHIAMAGLLHDIGLSEVSGAVLDKTDEQRTPDERAAYQKHPIASVALVQNRKMVVPEIVLKIIAQHHERFDGKGYPNELRGTKIRPEAQLVAIADELCYLMVPSQGQPRLSPYQAILKIYEGIPSGEDGHRFDPDLVRKLFKIFKPAN